MGRSTFVYRCSPRMRQRPRPSSLEGRNLARYADLVHAIGSRHGHRRRDRVDRGLRRPRRGRPRAALARGGGHHARARRVRGARGRRAGALRGARGADRGGQARRRDRARRRRAPGRRHLRRGADRARDGLPGRLSRGRDDARDADRAARLPRRRVRRSPTSRRRSAGSRPTGCRGRAGSRASPPSRRRRARSSSATAGTPSCTELRRFLDRNQITLQVAHARRARRGRGVGRPAACRRTDCPAIRVVDGKTVVRPQLRRVAELLGARHRAGRGGVRRGRSSAPGRPGWRRPCTARRRGCARSWSSARRPAARPAPRRGSRTTSASRRASPATSSRAGRCSRRGGSAPRSSSRGRSRGSTPATRQVHLDGGDVLRARTIILACGVTWRRLDDRGLRPARRKGHLLRRRPQRGGERPRPRRPHRRRRQLRRPGGHVLLHPRAERHHPLPRRDARARACRAT